MTEEIYKKWFSDRGDQLLRVNYDINKNSTIFDVGGYLGLWSDLMINKYDCNIRIFEPVKEYFDHMIKKYEHNKKVKLYNFGFSDITRDTEISLIGDSSSIYKNGELHEKINLIDISEFLDRNNIIKVDLIKINAEGEEYKILKRLLETNKISIFEDIQVQFHMFTENYKDKRDKIREELIKTHTETYCYEFVWENWKKRK